MNQEKTRTLYCYACGWLGMCVIACPLPDPAAAIPSDCTTTPDVEDDAPFEITLECEPGERDAGARESL